MAEVFEKISKKVVDVADSAKTKAKELYDLTKLKIDLRKKEADLDECFEKLGRAYYVQIKRQMENSDKVTALLEKADAISQEIVEIKTNIANAQNKVICTHCASVISTDAPYCSNCGQKVVAEKKKENEASKEEE